MIHQLGQQQPTVDPAAYVCPSADLIGDVHVTAQASVWFQAVLRGDNEPIRVGEGSNIQDGVVIHTDPGFPCLIGRNCVVGHRAVLHGCELGDEVLIGIGAIVLNGAKIPDGCLIGAGALVTEGKELESGGLYMGVPAKKVRDLTPEQRAGIRRNALGYQKRAERYRAELNCDGIPERRS